MSRTIDFKSALIGGLSTVVILCLLGAVSYVHPDEYGRFQIQTNDSHAFVLDSATGQVWSGIFSETATGYEDNFHAAKADESIREGIDGSSSPQSR
jgi:hypothetical protein